MELQLSPEALRLGLGASSPPLGTAAESGSGSRATHSGAGFGNGGRRHPVSAFSAEATQRPPPSPRPRRSPREPNAAAVAAAE